VIRSDRDTWSLGLHEIRGTIIHDTEYDGSKMVHQANVNAACGDVSLAIKIYASFVVWLLYVTFHLWNISVPVAEAEQLVASIESKTQSLRCLAWRNSRTSPPQPNAPQGWCSNPCRISCSNSLCRWLATISKPAADKQNQGVQLAKVAGKYVDCGPDTTDPQKSSPPRCRHSIGETVVLTACSPSHVSESGHPSCHYSL